MRRAAPRRAALPDVTQECLETTEATKTRITKMHQQTTDKGLIVLNLL